MFTFKNLKAALIASTGLAAFATGAAAEQFNIPAGDLKKALDIYAQQTGAQLLVSTDAVKGVRTRGVQGDMGADAALTQLLSGTGFKSISTAPGAIGIMRERSSTLEPVDPVPMQLAQVTPSRAAVETVTVTSSKLGGADVQSIPIAITALSQEQLTATQTAGGPDLVKQVPNLTFTKTNFTGYSIQIRGIGTQAISVTTDPAVAVAFNDVPFIRNHFFEQEFYDVSNVEVLRGPQGTLYGRNATSGVVNLISAKPTDRYEALASLDVGNYNNRRLEGMLNIPLIDNKLDIRAAGEWTKRDGYVYDDEIDRRVDGRDLWSSRLSLLVRPFEKLTANIVWEHFSEDDDRMRTAKQLCKRHDGPSVVDGPAGPQSLPGTQLTVGCQASSLYSADAFETPNSYAIPFIGATGAFGLTKNGFDAYGGVTQSRDLRTISSAIKPNYTAKNDTIELNIEYAITPELTIVSQSAYNKDFLYSTEDYNRFNTAPGVFADTANRLGGTLVGQDGQFCDPQLGCSDRIVGEDISQEHAKQYGQEFRVVSNFSGPVNFSVGANYLHYDTVEDYYVLFNALTLLVEALSNSSNGLGNLGQGALALGNAAPLPPDAPHIPFGVFDVNACGPAGPDPSLFSLSFIGSTGLGCTYVDPNTLAQIDGQGHNYFRSQNPYTLTSWAGFGEFYYQATPDVKLTAGLRWTDDKKMFIEIPSWAAIYGKGFLTTGVVFQQWREWTGRFNATWTPKLDFTDQSLFYASYSRGYKGGGANPPSVIVGPRVSPSVTTHPDTFEPEFIDAFELGTKNSLLDSSLTVNGDLFFYKYQNYQISQIVDRSSVNLNFDAHVEGAEIEATWEPLPGLRFNFAGGYEHTRLADGSQAIDLIDRTNGHSDWLMIKPYVTQTSNCILPTYVINERMAHQGLGAACIDAYTLLLDPVTEQPYVANPDPVGLPGYVGFDPMSAPNAGQGFAKDLSGNSLPNSPPFTLSLGAQFSMPLSGDWAVTMRADGYWQGNSFARVFNDKPYDQIHGYTNLNLALIFTNQDGWQAMLYAKNVFDTTAITGTFLNSDDTALTTNVFVTDPRLFGIRITKNW